MFPRTFQSCWNCLNEHAIQQLHDRWVKESTLFTLHRFQYYWLMLIIINSLYDSLACKNYTNLWFFPTHYNKQCILAVHKRKLYLRSLYLPIDYWHLLAFICPGFCVHKYNIDIFPHKHARWKTWLCKCVYILTLLESACKTHCFPHSTPTHPTSSPVVKAELLQSRLPNTHH